MIFILGNRNLEYHQSYKYKDVYYTKCKQDNLIFPRFGVFSYDKKWMYPNAHIYLNIHTVCKKCLELNREEILFYLIKIKLGAKV